MMSTSIPRWATYLLCVGTLHSVSCSRQGAHTEEIISVLRCDESGVVEVVGTRIDSGPSRVQFVSPRYLIRGVHGDTLASGTLDGFPLEKADVLLLRNGSLVGIATRTAKRGRAWRLPIPDQGDSWASIILSESIEVVWDFGTGRATKVSRHIEQLDELAENYVNTLGPDEVRQLESSIVLLSVSEVPVAFSFYELAKLPALTSLRLPRAPTIDEVAAINKCTRLEVIYLNDARMTDAQLQDLANLNGIKSLVLPKTGISQQAVGRLQAKLGCIRVLQDEAFD